MAAGEPGQDREGDDVRIDSLGRRIHDLEGSRGKPGKQGVDANYRLGNRVLADLIGGIVGGGGFGWFLDWLLGTSPWLLFVFLALGIIIAFRNIIRLSNEHSAADRGNGDGPKE